MGSQFLLIVVKGCMDDLRPQKPIGASVTTVHCINIHPCWYAIGAIHKYKLKTIHRQL